MSARRSTVAVIVLGVCAGLALATLLAVGRGGGRPSTGEQRPVAAPAHSAALDVLHRWDRARARAWAAGDPAELRRLYVHGSAAGRADTRLLRRYVDRGLVVRRMAMQVLAVEVLPSQPRRLRLVVTDRLAGGVAVAGDREVRLPGDAASTRFLELRREGADWRVAAVRDRR
ncbi:MAG: hypothetical protein ACR2FG_06170 [Marmoricola sp.]